MNVWVVEFDDESFSYIAVGALKDVSPVLRREWRKDAEWEVTAMTHPACLKFMQIDRRGRRRRVPLRAVARRYGLPAGFVRRTEELGEAPVPEFVLREFS